MRRAFAIFLAICFIAFSLDGRFVFFRRRVPWLWFPSVGALVHVSEQPMAFEPAQTISAPVNFDLRRLN